MPVNASEYRRLIGQEVVASHLGVTSQAMSNWYKREAEDIAAGRPAWGMPTAIEIEMLEDKPPRRAYRRNQLPVWEKWFAKHLAKEGDHIPRRNRKAA